jgi:hypothetical protein
MDHIFQLTKKIDKNHSKTHWNGSKFGIKGVEKRGIIYKTLK